MKMFIKNIIFTAISQVILMISGFVIPKIMVTIYGSEVNGLVTSINQVMTYLTLIEGGLSSASIYALYKPLSKCDNDEINGIVTATKKSYYKAGTLLTIALVFIAFIYPLLIKTNKLTYFEVVFLFIIIGLSTVIDFFVLAKYRALLSADQRTYVISISTIFQTLISTAIIWILSILNVNIVLVRLIALSSLIVRTLILLVYCKHKYPFLNSSSKPLPERLDKKWDALFLQILGAIHRGSPIIIATLLLSLNDVSIYSIYNMVLVGVSSILSIFMNGLQSSFGDVLARGEVDVFKKAYKEFETVFIVVATILYSVTLITILPFIKIYTANMDINYVFVNLAILFTINEYLYCLKNPQGMIVMSAGLYKETKWQTFMQGLICVVCSFIFCYFWGLKGILVGRILSNIYRDIDLLFFIPSRFNSLKVKDTFFKWMLSVLCFALCGIFGLAINVDFVNSYIKWIIFAFIVFIVCGFAIGLCFFVFYKREIKSVFKRFIGILKK